MQKITNDLFDWNESVVCYKIIFNDNEELKFACLKFVCELVTNIMKTFCERKIRNLLRRSFK